MMERPGETEYGKDIINHRHKKQERLQEDKRQSKSYCEIKEWK
jgi:hypothetical protein